MKRSLLTCLILLLFIGPTAAFAGEIISFVNSDKRNRVVVIPKADLRALVAEFLDPAKTGVGKSLGYLIWKETLSAISDQGGAGVILARAPEGKNLTELIGTRYHAAAREIAKFQKANMMLWGAVIENPDARMTINTHLTLLSNKRRSGKLVLRLTQGGQPGDGIKAGIQRSKFNFSAVTRSRADLFARPIIATKRSNIRKAPDRRAKIIGRVGKGRVLQAVDMSGGWFKIKLNSQKQGYIHINQVDVPSKTIEIRRRKVNLRAGPGTNFDVVVKASLRGTFPVLDRRYVKGKGLWYSFMHKGRPVWIYAKLVKPRYSLPSIHFLAGLYRYYAGRFVTASEEFERFVSAKEGRRDINLATGFQLIGTSRIMGKHPASLNEADISYFSKAVALTPYDPGAYNMRALANIAVTGNLELALKDLDKSLTLDRRNLAGVKLVQDLNKAVRNPGSDNRYLLRLMNPAREQIKKLNVLQKRVPIVLRKSSTLPLSCDKTIRATAVPRGSINTGRSANCE